jgi:hypothetical protein
MRFRTEVVDVQESPMIQIAALAETNPDVIQLCYGESGTPLVRLTVTLQVVHHQ